MIWAILNKERIKATKKAVAACPLCGSLVIPKCGNINIHHWAHRAGLLDCDPWHEPESDWHLNWKNRFPAEWQEVRVGNHIADIKTPTTVIEFQASPLSREEIGKREYHYKDMIWVLNGKTLFSSLLLPKKLGISYQWVDWKNARKSWFYTDKPVFIDFDPILVQCGYMTKGSIALKAAFLQSIYKRAGLATDLI